MKKLTKKQAEQYFKENILPSIKETEQINGNGKDSVMRSGEWSYFTDSLCKNGEITDEQYANWNTPNFC